MIDAVLRPRAGCGELATCSARVASDATRVVADCSHTGDDRSRGAAQSAFAMRQRGPTGRLCIRAALRGASSTCVFGARLEDDHYLSSFRASRPIRCSARRSASYGGSPDSRHKQSRTRCCGPSPGSFDHRNGARAIERARSCGSATPALEASNAAPTTADLARFTSAQPSNLGSRAAGVGRAFFGPPRSLDLEALKDIPTDAVARRLERERGFGPRSGSWIRAFEGLGS